MQTFERDGMAHVEFYDDAGKRHRESLRVPWGDHAGIAAAISKRFSSGPAPVPIARGPTLLAIYNKALASHYAKHADRKGVEGKWKHDIEPFFGGDTPIRECARAEKLADFKMKCFDKGNHPKTVNRKLMVISKLFKLAVEWDHLDKCPKMPLEDEDEGRVRWVSDSEEATGMAFLRAGAGGGGRVGNTGDPNAPKLQAAEFADLCEFLMDTGLRLSEALRMQDRWYRFDHTPPLVMLPASITKSRKARTVPMTALAARHVYLRLARDKAAHAALPGSSTPWGDFTHDRCGKLWDAMRAAMNLSLDEDFVIHALRHTYAVRMLEAGEDIRVLQYLMGHAKPETTAIYAHVSPRLIKGAVERLEARAKDVPEVSALLRAVK